MPGPELTPLSKAMSRLPDGRSVSRRPDRLLAEPVGPECPPDSRVISEAPTPGVPGTQYRNPTASHVFHAMAVRGRRPAIQRRGIRSAARRRARRRVRRSRTTGGVNWGSHLDEYHLQPQVAL